MHDCETIDENRRISELIALEKSTLPPDGGSRFNRLIFATSPYLLQHADNPMDWYPWGTEAFARAAAEDKPVFLSIGYSTCHWCHVMAHESFADPEVAAAFNRHFICIKVDREERPDIDEQYMAVAQMMTGSGGWPLNLFLTPDKRPFHATTYLPKTPRMGMPGIITLLEAVARAWAGDRQRLEESAAEAISALGRHARAIPGSLPDEELGKQAYQQLSRMYDRKWGGFGTAPKFPMPLYLSFLLRHGRRTGDPSALEMVEHCLRLLRQGGIYDQLGFGIHRYAVDQQWQVPHFEKMLYDQALVATAYLEAHQSTGSPFYRQVAEEIFTYALAEMRSPEGGFYAGLDADSEGEEGTCYLWSQQEIESVIGPDAGARCCQLFGVTKGGNFEGRNILHLPLPPAVFAGKEGILPKLFAAEQEQWRQALLTTRRLRIQPFRDEKILTGWNGLMIAALARGYAVNGDVRLLTAAHQAAEFIKNRLTTPTGRLLRSFHLGSGSIPAFLEDYAGYIWGLLELHQATLEPAYLDRAAVLADAMLQLFSNSDGELFDTGNDSEQLPVRQQSTYDGVTPSGSSMAAFILFRLGRICDDLDWLTAGEQVARSCMGTVRQQPVTALHLLAAVDYHRGPEVIVTLSGEKHALPQMLQTVHRRFVPGLALRSGGDDYPAINDQPTAYVCAQGACRPPATTTGDLGALMDALA